METPTPTPAFNLTIPTYTHGNPGDTRWLSPEQTVTHNAEQKARKQVLIGLMQAISPELARLVPGTGGWRSLFTFTLDSYRPTLEVKEMRTGQIEARLENGSRDSRNTFRRFSIDKKAGTIDARFVQGVRDLVALGYEMIDQDAASKERSDAAANQKADEFAHAISIVATEGLKWAYDRIPDPVRGSGDIHIDGYSNRVSISGRTMKVELDGMDIDKLPALVAFIRSLKS